MAGKYEVVLRDDAESVSCGHLYVYEIQRYLRKLSLNKVIPADSCIYDIRAKFFKYDDASVYIDSRIGTNRSNEVHSGCLQINVCNISAQKCPTYNCFRNIQNGNCTDKFMIKIIGQEFFADKYKDTNTKQR